MLDTCVTNCENDHVTCKKDRDIFGTIYMLYTLYSHYILIQPQESFPHSILWVFQQA